MIIKKFCVFCGNRPEEKTNEHILPLWLLSLTGDPNRIVNLGINKIGKIKQREYSFDSFKFPACNKCNSKYSLLESQTRLIILKLLNEESISAYEIDKLLDWFDKVRVGLWLGNYILDKNIAAIKPNFYIANRISQWDRLIHISKVDCIQKGLTFIGTEAPSFFYTPSCFGLIINNLYFINISYDFLFSRRIGFPYPVAKKLFPTTNYQEVDLVAGTNRIMKPLIHRRFQVKGIELYQPIFSKFISNEGKSLYENEYIISNSLDWKNGKGKIFYSSKNKYSVYPELASPEWLLPNQYDRFDVHYKYAIEVLEWQIFINDIYPNLDSLPKDEQYSRKKLITYCNSINKKLINLYKKQNNAHL